MGSERHITLVSFMDSKHEDQGWAGLWTDVGESDSFIVEVTMVSKTKSDTVTQVF